MDAPFAKCENVRRTTELCCVRDSMLFIHYHLSSSLLSSEHLVSHAHSHPSTSLFSIHSSPSSLSFSLNPSPLHSFLHPLIQDTAHQGQRPTARIPPFDIPCHPTTTHEKHVPREGGQETCREWHQPWPRLASQPCIQHSIPIRIVPLVQALPPDQITIPSVGSTHYTYRTRTHSWRGAAF